MFETLQTLVAIALFTIISLSALTAQADTVASSAFAKAPNHITAGKVEIN